MSITNKLNQIKNAIYGKEVRGAIHDAIKECYDEASVNHDNANMEVKMARGTHNTLNDRLDNVDEIQAQTNAQLSEKGLNILNYIQAPENTINQAIQRAINDIKDKRGYIYLPASETPYLISDTIYIGEKEDQTTFKFGSIGANGAYYGFKQATIQRSNVNDSYPMLQIFGRGYTVENICFDGQGKGDLVIVGRGFEAVFEHCRFYRSGNVGLKGYAMQNAEINSCYFDENKIGLVLDYGYDFGVCNTVFINKCHFERNTGIDCSVAYDLNGDDNIHFSEFIFFNNCHFEATTNTGGVAKELPTLLIGNVRECYIDNSFFYGGKVDLLRIDSRVDNNETKYKGVSVTNTSFVGHMTNHIVDDKTPNNLILLKNGDGFNISGCSFDCCKNAYIKVDSSFGKNINILPCYKKQVRTGASDIAVIDNRLGDNVQHEAFNIVQSITVGDNEAQFIITGKKGSGSSRELNIYPLRDNRTLSFDTLNGSRVMSIVPNNTTPKWGVFGSTSEKVTVTGAKGGNEALDNLLKALVKFGLITDNTSS